MPIYAYEVLDEKGEVVEIFEAEQPLGAEPLKLHPVTGELLRKVFTSPGINTTYADWDGKLESGKLTKAGFTKYERDKTTGRYFKANVGKGPEELDPHAGDV
ncbi:MAG: FmdB family transcriptional regulator [Verrucomicrobiota bacterium]